ncbi:MAG: DUF2283 domain-containing protein [Chloroflexia bacterium]|nr:DUF2283 domain-containing protein [Chloroflexia bacterium]
MKITYDPDVDALYIKLRELPILKSVDYEEGVTLDLGEGGGQVGVEILDASLRQDPEDPWPALTRANAEAA